MGDDWEDDSWEDDDIEEKLAAKEKTKAKEDSEDEDDAPPPASAASPAVAKAKPKPKAKAKVAEPEPVLSAQEQKLRQRKLQEAQNDGLVGDLFDGFQVKETEEEKNAAARKAEEDRKAAKKKKIVEIDAFDQVTLSVQADVERLSEACVTKIGKGAAAAKGGSVSFMRDLLKQLADDLSFKELDGFEKMLAEVVKGKKAAKGAATDGKANKANTKLSKTTKFNATNEWEEVYGGGAGDEDWTQEEWDEWEKSEAAKWEQSQKK